MGTADGDFAVDSEEAYGGGAVALDAPGGDEEGAVDTKELARGEEVGECLQGNLRDDIVAMVTVDAGIVAAGLDVLDVGDGDLDALVADLDGDALAGDCSVGAESEFALLQFLAPEYGLVRLGHLQFFVQNTDRDAGKGGHDIQHPQGLLVRFQTRRCPVV